MQQRFPDGWDEDRIRRVIEYYESADGNVAEPADMPEPTDGVTSGPVPLSRQGLAQYVPHEIPLHALTQSDYPALAKNPELYRKIEEGVSRIPTIQRIVQADCRKVLASLPDKSVHLVLTSPPYWTLKEYPDHPEQLGQIEDFARFLTELTVVWQECHRVLVSGGRMAIVVGDVSVRRRKHGRHMTYPLHASIIESCRSIGFDNLTPIIWQKNANATFEVERGGGFLGKPYEPNALIKNDIEFILLQRKAGIDGTRSYRAPTVEQRVLSLIGAEQHREWFQPVWRLRGESLRFHPAPYPLELAARLVRMFSFVGDTVLDPFLGIGTTLLAAGMWGRNGIGCDVEPQYVQHARFRLVSGLSCSTILVESAPQVGPSTHQSEINNAD